MSIDSDLHTLHVFLDNFDPYLKSEAVFWNVDPNLPALTVGAVPFLRRTLAARRSSPGLSPAQQAEVDQLEAQAAQLFNRWPVNIEQKALREISSRLNVLASALEETGDNYAPAAQNRAYLALLMPIVARREEAGRYRDRLSALDSRLRSRWVNGDFIWEAGLAAAFPRDEFWFLDGKPARQA
jgi:hypothetical protein